MSFERPENIRSTLDLRHLDRMSREPESPPAELPLLPEIDPADLKEGPRIPLRYGSAPTEIWISRHLWRRTDGLPEHVWHYQNRWRPLSELAGELEDDRDDI